MHLACRGPGRARAPRPREPARRRRMHHSHSQACALRRVVEAAAACRVRGPLGKTKSEMNGLSPLQLSPVLD